MRFSIKWLLAAVAYIALIAAAIASLNGMLASVAWLLSFCVICYAVVTAFIAGERRRAMAIGFVVLAVGNVLCVYLAPRELPAVRLLSALGYGFDNDDGSLFVRVAAEATGFSRAVSVRQRIQGSSVVTRTLNAVGTLLAGLLGAGIGALAYKHAGGRSDFRA